MARAERFSGRGTHVGFFHRFTSLDCFLRSCLVLLLLLLMVLILMLARLTLATFLTQVFTRRVHNPNSTNSINFIIEMWVYETKVTYPTLFLLLFTLSFLLLLILPIKQ